MYTTVPPDAVSYGLLSLCPATTARLQAVDAELIYSSPYQIGPVNAYLAGRTLVDPGDIERVVVTHPHLDVLDRRDQVTRHNKGMLVYRESRQSASGSFGNRRFPG